MDTAALGADDFFAEGDSNPDFGAVVDIAGALLCQLIVPATVTFAFSFDLSNTCK
ncbi:MAG: hypothetical protein K0B01_08025 [Syntrophobacterales bacterium]|nr:hypothetical protein [Syntrophobacterales bacterium]